MTHQLYLKCVIACLIGNIFHIAAKVLMAWRDHRAANLEFSFGKYLKDDRVPIIVDAIFSFGVVYLIDELIGYVPWALAYVKAFFVLLGFGGSYLIINILSKADKKFRAAVSHKTGIADSTTGNQDKPTPTS